jgi:hypothetical protein
LLLLPASEASQLSVRWRFTGTDQEFSFDRPVRRGGTCLALLVVMVIGNAHIHPQITIAQ